MDIELTKSAKKSIAKIYKEYMQRVKAGESKQQARYFDNDKMKQAAFIASVKEDLPELKNAGFIKIFILECIELQDSAIIYMENLSSNTIKEWLSFGAQFLP